MALTRRDGKYISYSDSITITSTTEILQIPTLFSGAKISVTAIPGANSALVEHTTSLDEDVLASAVWQEWPSGTVTETTGDVITSPITGLRFTAIGGECTFEIVI